MTNLKKNENGLIFLSWKLLCHERLDLSEQTLLVLFEFIIEVFLKLMQENMNSLKKPKYFYSRIFARKTA